MIHSVHSSSSHHVLFQPAEGRKKIEGHAPLLMTSPRSYLWYFCLHPISQNLSHMSTASFRGGNLYFSGPTNQPAKNQVFYYKEKGGAHTGGDCWYVDKAVEVGWQWKSSLAKPLWTHAPLTVLIDGVMVTSSVPLRLKDVTGAWLERTAAGIRWPWISVRLWTFPFLLLLNTMPIGQGCSEYFTSGKSLRWSCCHA